MPCVQLCSRGRPQDAPATIKARWVCEQAHQQSNEKLGLDHFEGRSWIGLQRLAMMAMAAYTFLQSRHLKAAGRKERIWRAAAKQPFLPAIRQARLEPVVRPPPGRCPHCEKLLIEGAQPNPPRLSQRIPSVRLPIENPLHEDIKLLNDEAILRLVGAILIEQKRQLGRPTRLPPAPGSFRKRHLTGEAAEKAAWFSIGGLKFAFDWR